MALLVRSPEMNVPPITDACWSRLAQSDEPVLHTCHLPTRLLLQRVLASRDNTTVKAAQLFAYFARWSDSLGAELAQIREI
jgi:hypothetical protein